MSQSLTHRGPDMHAEWLSTHEQGLRIGLAHRRLSIIDLSDAGAQPMANETESLQLIFNGEIYNFQDLRSELETLGHRFKSNSDSEVILHGYEEWGLESCLGRLNGMFAFALWDQEQQSLFFARDRMGQKPLYYVETEEGGIAFASEIKALEVGGFIESEDIDFVALDQFWTFGYIQGERSIFPEVKQLKPGHWAQWGDEGFTQKRYWAVPRPQPQERSLDELADELHELLSDAVRLRLIADVSVGLFLSAGVDSALIASIAREVHEGELNAYTIAFNEAEFDESQAAAQIADHLGITHTILPMGGMDADLCSQVAQQFDEPFGDGSCVPTYLVCQLARKHCKVAITGDAGDELFAGYDDYKTGMQIWGGHSRDQSGLKSQLKDFRLRTMGPGKGFCYWGRRMSQPYKKKLYTSEAFQKMDFNSVMHERLEQAERLQGVDPLAVMQHIDMHTYLPNDVLVKVDRMSMANSLECRSPFLDHRVVEFSSKLPLHARMDEQGNGKVLLRHLLKRYLPRELTDRPKQGFTAPWHEWLRGAWGRQQRDRWSRQQAGLYKTDAVDWLLPEAGASSHVLPWNAFASIEFFTDSVS